MTVVVETEEGPYFCVGDSVFVMGNIDAPQEMQDELHYDICPPGRYVDIVAAWKTVRDTVRRCKEAGVDPHKHLLLAHDVILTSYSMSTRQQSLTKMLEKQQRKLRQNISARTNM